MDTDSSIDSIEDVDDSKDIEDQIAILVSETGMRINDALNHVQDVRGMMEHEVDKIIEGEHKHHQIRMTTTKMVLDIGDFAEVQMEIEDTYCFTCGEWLCSQGIEPRGTPRSKKDAWWVAGPPEEVEEAREDCRDALAEMADEVVEKHPTVEDREEALGFIEDQIEQMD